MTPRPLQLSPIPFSTRLGELTAPVVIQDSDGWPIVVEPSPGATGRLNLAVYHLRSNRSTHHRGMDDRTELGDFAVRHLSYRAERLYALPPGRVVDKVTPLLSLLRVAPFLIVPALVILLATSSLPGMVIGAVNAALVFGLILAIFRWPRRLSSHRFHYLADGGQYALEDVFDERPHAEAARAKVGELKEEYGALLSDLVYRIENPALFDPAFEPTRVFTAAMIDWDAHAREDSAELGLRAAELRVRFDAARAAAEAAGMEYLPAEAREPAGRAAKAARLAASTDSQGERRAALKQAVDILASLAIYYLPNPSEAQEMIEGRRLLALPGRLSTEEQ